MRLWAEYVFCTGKRILSRRAKRTRFPTKKTYCERNTFLARGNDYVVGHCHLSMLEAPGQRGSGGAGRLGRCQVGSGKQRGARLARSAPPSSSRSGRDEPRATVASTAIAGDCAHRSRRPTSRDDQRREGHLRVVVSCAKEHQRASCTAPGEQGAPVRKRRGRGHGKVRRGLVHPSRVRTGLGGARGLESRGTRGGGHGDGEG